MFRLPATFDTRIAWPSQCAICRGWQSQRICEPCWQRHATPVHRCRRCASRLPAGAALCGQCIKEPPPYLSAVAALDYDYPWDGLLSAVKFRAALDLVPAFAGRLHDALQQHAAPPCDLLLPTPLAPSRLRERGHNQAWEIARRLARRLGRPADATLLLRIKDTPHQLALPKAQREANVRAAFAVEPRRRGELAGRHVAVVDDVMTTGATAAEMARTLLQAGAAGVHIWVLARTPLD